jgi:hypothetical protein
VSITHLSARLESTIAALIRADYRFFVKSLRVSTQSAFALCDTKAILTSGEAEISTIAILALAGPKDIEKIKSSFASFEVEINLKEN